MIPVCFTRPLPPCGGPLKRLLASPCAAWILSCLLLLLGVSILQTPAASAAMYPGFRTLGMWNEEQRLRLDLCVWYPVRNSPSKVRYGDWVLSVNRRASPLQGRYPLIVISHDSAGGRFAHHELAAALSCMGFIVAAPTHARDNAQDMTHLFTAGQLTQRLDELRQTIDTICADPELGQIADPNRIGLLGFGTGAATALLVAGGKLSAPAWESWKKTAPQNAPYMYTWTRSRIDTMLADPELAKIRSDYRVRSVALAAPTFGMLFDGPSLSKIRIPTLLIAVGRDPLNPAPDYLNHLRNSLPSPPRTAFIPEATPLALMTRPDGRTEHLPTRVPLPERVLEQTLLALQQEAGLFFQETLGDPNMPPALPPEPDPVPPPVEIKETPPPAPPAQSGRRTKRKK